MTKTKNKILFRIFIPLVIVYSVLISAMFVGLAYFSIKGISTVFNFIINNEKDKTNIVHNEMCYLSENLSPYVPDSNVYMNTNYLCCIDAYYYSYDLKKTINVSNSFLANKQIDYYIDTLCFHSKNYDVFGITMWELNQSGNHYYGFYQLNQDLTGELLYYFKASSRSIIQPKYICNNKAFFVLNNQVDGTDYIIYDYVQNNSRNMSEDEIAFINSFSMDMHKTLSTDKNEIVYQDKKTKLIFNNSLSEIIAVLEKNYFAPRFYVSFLNYTFYFYSKVICNSFNIVYASCAFCYDWNSDNLTYGGLYIYEDLSRLLINKGFNY